LPGPDFLVNDLALVMIEQLPVDGNKRCIHPCQT
jgi:hypothetical protein